MTSLGVTFVTELEEEHNKTLWLVPKTHSHKITEIDSIPGEISIIVFMPSFSDDANQFVQLSSTNKEVSIIKTKEWKYGKEEINVILAGAAKNPHINVAKLKTRAVRGPIIIMALKGTDAIKTVNSTAHVATANKKAFYLAEAAEESKAIFDFVFGKDYQKNAVVSI